MKYIYIHLIHYIVFEKKEKKITRQRYKSDENVY